MITLKKDKIIAKPLIELSEDSIRLNSGYLIVDNNFLSLKGFTFKFKEFISNSLTGDRTRFFKNRNYAVCLLICIDSVYGISVKEGLQVPFMSISSVPLPEYENIPLLGVVLIQDGTSDLNFGIKPLKEENLIFFSSIGNIMDKNKKGEKGENSIVIGETGIQGVTGIQGLAGVTGVQGITGVQGPALRYVQGCTGLQGMTGINWDIYIPFDVLI